MPSSTTVTRSRSLLFAPAVRVDFLEKLAGRGADVVAIDCEDATPPNDDAKQEARRNAAQWGPRLAGSGQQVVVRVNSVGSRWFADDVTQALAGELSAVIIPKIETLDQLDTAANALSQAGLAELGILAGIETALGVERVTELLSHDQVNGAYFGAEDFIADMGGVRTKSNEEVAYARSRVVLAARIGGVPALDMVVSDFGDRTRFETECRQARSLGYGGKLCIHPDQVALANEGFTPSPAEVERATRLVAAYERAIEQGLAATDFEGEMIDEPLATQARRVIAQADNG